MAIFLAWATLIIWTYLIAARGQFWCTRERHDRGVPAAPARWPSLAVVIPARDEEESIARTIGTILSQNYAGALHVVVVDDNSSDATAVRARTAADGANAANALTVMAGASLPVGWTGKVWAMQQGFEKVITCGAKADYVLFTDADISYKPQSLADLASRAVSGDHVLTSVMVKLRCESFAERFFIPAFVYFFRMLYPFSWVARSARQTAAAAGGCMLVKTEALKSIGGFNSLKDALIDDCSLARRLSAEGSMWLGLTRSISSIRAYEGLAPIGRMVRRSAYAQLGFSPLLLAVSMAAMALTFVGPPLLAASVAGQAALPAAAAYLLMVLSFLPTMRFYRLNPLWSLALPVVALFYMAWTIGSAIEHGTGRGGEWKGRFQAGVQGIK